MAASRRIVVALIALGAAFGSFGLLAAAGGQGEEQRKAQEKPPAVLLERVLRSPSERSGDYDALAREWLDGLKAIGRPQPWPLQAHGQRIGTVDGLAAELLLVRLIPLLSKLADPAGLAPLVEEARRLHYPEGFCRFLLDRVAEELAPRPKAAGAPDETRRAGYLRRWAIIGPFGLGGPSQLLRPFPPESEIDGEAAYPSRGRTLRWHAPERSEFSVRRIVPAHFIYPHRGVVYLLGQVRAAETREAVLHISSQQQVAVWVNGHPLESGPLDFGRPVQQSHGLLLPSGVSRILIKTLAEPDAGLWARLTGPDGEPAEGLSVDVPFEAKSAGGAPRPVFAPPNPFTGSPAWGGPFRASAIGPWEKLVDGIERAAGENRPPPGVEADARMGLALLIHGWGTSPDRSLMHAERALALRPDDPALQAHAGEILLAASHLPRDHVRSRARAAFEEALRRDADYLPAYLPLARFLAEDNETGRAIDTLKGAVERRRGFLAARAQLIELYERKDWDAEADDIAREIEALAPASPVPPLHRMRRYKDRDNPRRALQELNGAIEKHRHGQREMAKLLEEAAELAEETGDLVEAARSFEERLKVLDQMDPAAARRRAQFLERTGDLDAAAVAWKNAEAASPADPEPAEALGKLQESRGHDAEARAWYERALSREPGDIHLARYLARRASPQSKDEFWAPYDESLDGLRAQIPVAAKFPGSSSLVVLDIAVLKLYPDGSSSEYVHQAEQLLSEEAKDELASVRIDGEVQLLRTVTEDGRTLEPVAATGKRQFTMPAVEPGAIVDWAYRADRPRRREWMVRGSEFFFQDVSFRKPFLLSRYVVILPPGIAVDLVERALEGDGPRPDRSGAARAKVTRREAPIDGGGRVVIYEARDAGRLEREIAMPHREDYIPNVELLERRTWDDVASVLEDGLLRSARVTPEIERAAREALAGLAAGASAAEKARALYGHVNDLVADSSGERDAAKVLVTRAGDRTVLFKALLDAAGVSSRWCYLRPREQLLPRDDGSHPRPDGYSARYLLLDGDGAGPQWVSLTTRRMPFGKLPRSLQGGTALLLGGLVLGGAGGARLAPVPSQSIEDSAVSTAAELRLSAPDLPDQAARVRLHVTASRAEDFGQKERLQTLKEDLKRQALSSTASGYFPGSKLLDGSLPGLDDLDAPLQLQIEMEAPRVLVPHGEGEVLLKPVLQPASLIRNLIRRARRDHPYRLGQELVYRDRVEVAAGARYAVARLPAAVSHQCAAGLFSIVYVRAGPDGDGGERIRVERQLTLLPVTMAHEEFPRLVEFCQAVDRAEAERIVLRRTTHGGR